MRSAPVIGRRGPAAQHESHGPEEGRRSVDPYEALLHSFGYNERFTPEALAEARTRLERAVQQDPGNGDWGRVFPSGAATAYDVMTVTTHKSLASALDGGSTPNRGLERFMKANPGKSYSSYVTNGAEYSAMQRRTITQVVALVERAAAAGRTSENR